MRQVFPGRGRWQPWALAALGLALGVAGSREVPTWFYDLDGNPMPRLFAAGFVLVAAIGLAAQRWRAIVLTSEGLQLRRAFRPRLDLPWQSSACLRYDGGESCVVVGPEQVRIGPEYCGRDRLLAAIEQRLGPALIERPGVAAGVLDHDAFEHGPLRLLAIRPLTETFWPLLWAGAGAGLAVGFLAGRAFGDGAALFIFVGMLFGAVFMMPLAAFLAGPIQVDVSPAPRTDAMGAAALADGHRGRVPAAVRVVDDGTRNDLLCPPTAGVATALSSRATSA